RYSHSGSTAIGDLIRDDGGRFIQAFTAYIGDCSITKAELSAIIQGLKLAWAIGIRRIIVRSDSRTYMSILQREATDNHTHVYREANCGPDYLANLGHSFNFGLHLFTQPDSVLAQWLRYDLVGVALPRVISF
ncbi:Putative ribonuclease H protein At1g65750, partial [Linum perenne]